MDESGRKSLTEWWQGLSGAWRLNGLLYLLTVIALLALVVEVVSGGGETPKRVQVASRQTGRTTTTFPRPLTTTAPLATSTTVPGPTTTADTSGPAGGGVASAPQRGGGPSAPAPLVVPPAPSGGGDLVCLNSKNPACGPFSWQTPPGNNQPVTVSVDPSAVTVAPGQPVTFSVTVADPDHSVTANCGVVQFGDGAVAPLNCNRPSGSACASSFGPWVTPRAVNGRQLFKFTHAYAAGGPYSATFSFGTDQDACPDPYGSPAQTAQASVTVA
jgi:hypothetical protein